MVRLSSFFLISLSIFSFSTSHCLAVSGRVVQVISGDRLIILDGDSEVHVRLYGIDAPEHKQPYAREAMDFLLEKVMGREVEVEEIRKDHHGQVIGVLHHEGRNYNLELLKTGLAWVDYRYCNEDFCKAWLTEMETARKGGGGLWGAESPVPPWKWRWLPR